MSTLYYFHDPMCSWCWAFKPFWSNLTAELPDNIIVKSVVGGLAPDTEEPMPVEMQNYILDHWRNIHNQLGTPFNFGFWAKNQPRRSTYPACRAVIAAKNQGAENEMIDAIQRAYYLRAMNPSDHAVLVTLAGELAEQAQNFGISSFRVKQFQAELNAKETNDELNKQISSYHKLSGRGFPSLTFACNNRNYEITHDYKNHNATLRQILRLAEGN